MVAIKEVPLDGPSDTDLTSITHEIDLLRSLRHDNIVRCLGKGGGASWPNQLDPALKVRFVFFNSLKAHPFQAVGFKLTQPALPLSLGSTEANGYLYIMLEYAENGSLANVIKPNRFGAIPEALVKVYIAQLLAGLCV